MKLDHLVVGAATLEAARSHVEEQLGVSMQPGGQHAVFQTHNALLGLTDDLYLEAIAPDPSVPPPCRPRWYDLDRFSGPARLSNWACAVDDMDRELDGMPIGTGSQVAVRRGSFNWRMAVSDAGTTPFDNLWPAIIEWPAGLHPARSLSETGIRLRRLTLRHPRADELKQILAMHLRDDRVRVEHGTPGMHAVFDTPAGERSL